MLNDVKEKSRMSVVKALQLQSCTCARDVFGHAVLGSRLQYVRNLLIFFDSSCCYIRDIPFPVLIKV